MILPQLLPDVESFAQPHDFPLTTERENQRSKIRESRGSLRLLRASACRAMPRKYWTVVREHRFERELRALIRDAIRADQFVERAEFVLARDPRKGVEIPGTQIWFMPMAPIGDASLRVGKEIIEAVQSLLAYHWLSLVEVLNFFLYRV